MDVSVIKFEFCFVKTQSRKKTYRFKTWHDSAWVISELLCTRMVQRRTNSDGAGRVAAGHVAENRVKREDEECDGASESQVLLQEWEQPTTCPAEHPPGYTSHSGH